jgi:hypothetical protein
VTLRNRLARLVASDSDSSDGQTTPTATDGGTTTTSTTGSAASTPSAKARLASAIPKPLTRSTGDSQLWTIGGTEDYHEIEPAAYDYKRYRELATTVDIVGAGLDIKVGEIVRPGFYIDAEDDAAKEELTEWASGCAIHGGEIDQDFGSLLPQLVHGHLRDGDAPIELVWDDPEEGNTLEYLQPIDPATLALLTYPGSSMLILPDDDEPPEGTPTNDRGENAAYVQYPDADESDFYTDEEEAELSQVDVIRLPREPGFTERSPTGSGRSSAAAVSYLNGSDTGGNIRGTSLVERIADEAARLRALSQDYYNALAATSHPRLKIEFEDTVVEGTENGYTVTEIDPETGEPVDVEYEGPRVIHWDDESIGDFMDALDRDETQWDPTGDAHSGGEWTDPGGKIGTPPGVTANIVKADAPDIQHAATLSVNRIFGGLGVPKFMAGFGEDLNRRISEEQEKRFEQDVRSTRRYIEKRLTPIFELKAEELAERDDSDVSNTDGIAFKIGTEQQEDALRDEDFDAEKFSQLMAGLVQGSQVFPKEALIEQFVHMDPDEFAPDSPSDGSNGSGAEEDGQQENEQQESSTDTEPDSSIPSDEITDVAGDGESISLSAESPESTLDSVFDVDLPSNEETLSTSPDASLADPRLVSTEAEYRALKDKLASHLQGARDAMTSAIEQRLQRRPQPPQSARGGPNAATEQDTATLEAAVTAALSGYLAQAAIPSLIKPEIESVIESTREKLAADGAGQGPAIEPSLFQRIEDRDAIDYYVGQATSEIEDIDEDLARRVKTHLRRGVERGEAAETITARIENALSDSELGQRAGLIARMETSRATESLRMRAYRRSEDIAGVAIANPCTDTTTRLCQGLAGCGPRDGATAYFGADESIGEQLQEQAPAGTLFGSFDPLPDSPPFHFNCRSTLVPVFTQEPATDTGDAILASLSTGDPVSYGDGPQQFGVLVDVVQSPIEWPPTTAGNDSTDTETETIGGSSESPIYIVATPAGLDWFRASDLSSASLDDLDDDEPNMEQAESAELATVYTDLSDPYDADECAALAIDEPGTGFDDLPNNWSRGTVLRVYAQFGGDFNSCRREMRDNVLDPSGWCAALKDSALKTTAWRGGWS